MLLFVFVFALAFAWIADNSFEFVFFAFGLFEFCRCH